MARMLEAVGISATEESLWLAIVDHPGSTDVELAELTGLNVGEVQSAGTALGARGLVSRSATRPPRWVAAPVAVAVELLILQQQESLERTRLVATEIGERQRRAQPHDGGPPLEEVVEVVIGREAISQRHQQMQQKVRQEILYFDKGPYATSPDLSFMGLAPMLARGVRVRTVYDDEGLAAGHLAEAMRAAAAGEEARTAALPAKLVVADREIALLPLRDELEGALVVHPSPLLNLLVDLFERVWRDAGIFLAPPGVQTDLDPMNRRLLALLAAGAIDTAIAHDLGIAHRSVQARVRRLMRRLGARSRFQAGALAAARGWLSPSENDSVDPASAFRLRTSTGGSVVAAPD